MDQITPFYFSGDRMYVSTISSLNIDPLQIRIEAGEYAVKPYFGGFIYAKADYEPKFEEIVKVLALRDGDPGLSGTYHDGFTDNKAVIKLVNNYFISYIDTNSDSYLYGEYGEEDEYYDEEHEDEDTNDSLSSFGSNNSISKPRVTKLPDYNNFPVLFFLNTKAVIENLNLEKEYEDENKIAVWNVIDCDKGKIGVAIGQKCFHEMMGDQMGLAAFSVDGTKAVAFANFEAYQNVPDAILYPVFHPSHETNLEYNPYDVRWNRTKKNRINEV